MKAKLLNWKDSSEKEFIDLTAFIKINDVAIIYYHICNYTLDYEIKDGEFYIDFFDDNEIIFNSIDEAKKFCQEHCNNLLISFITEYME